MDLQDSDSNINNPERISTDIAQDLVKSIGSNLATDISELTIDSVLDGTFPDYEGIVEDIPIVKTAIGAYKAYKDISSFHYIKKLLAFIQEVDKRAASESDTDWFRDKFSESGKKQDKYVEYLLIVIDRYVGYERPQMLAKLFIAFLDHYISWEELTCYAEALEKLLPGDYGVLSKSNTYRQNAAATPSAVLRLVGMGLMVETSRPNAFTQGPNGNIGITWSSLSAVQKNEIEYSRTTFGDKLVNIVQDNYEA